MRSISLIAAGILLLFVIEASAQKSALPPVPKAPARDFCFKVIPAKFRERCWPGGEDQSAAETPLLEAISQRDMVLIKKLIADGADVNQADSRGNLPLMLTTRGDIELMDILLKAGASVKQAGERSSSLLHESTICSLAVRRLLDAGADPNSANINRHTPLMAAVVNQNLASVKILVKAGADLAAVDSEGLTPLLYAFKAGNAEIVYFLAARMDEKLLSEEKFLDRAMRFSILNSKIDLVRYLFTKGASIEGFDPAYNPLGTAVQLDNAEIVKLLIDGGAKVNHPTFASALFWAAHRGYPANIKLLLAAGAEVDEPFKNGTTWTPLMAASYYGYLETVKLLLDAGAKVNRTGPSNHTALGLAINAKLSNHADRTDIIKLLLERGADPNLTNDQE